MRNWACHSVPRRCYFGRGYRLAPRLRPSLSRLPAGVTPRGQAITAQQVLLGEVVPIAAEAHLDDEDLEFPVRHREHRKLCPAPRLAGAVTQLVAVYVVHLPEVLAAAHRAPDVGRLPVVLGGVLQVRRSVAHLVHTDATRVDLTQQRSLLERVVDHLPLGTHVARVRVDPRCPHPSAVDTYVW